MQLNLPPPRKHLISLTPLIDVVFILLLFFMLSSNFMPWKHMEIVLPSNGNSSTASRPTDNVLFIKVMPDNEFMMNGEVFSNRQLENTVRKYLNTNPNSHIVVEPYSNAVLQNIIDIFDRLKKTKLTNVTLGKVVSP